MKSCIKEITGDLFKVADDVSLAHCVSEDLEMGKGIAREFRKLFGKVDELRDQSK
jgi:O-acetyl-ADP-ribose deacetylase (regulator of RNase III)